MKGTIRWFSLEKGYGYIKADDHQDVLVLVKELKNIPLSSVRIKQRVEFDVFHGLRGPQAKNVLIIESSAY